MNRYFSRLYSPIELKDVTCQIQSKTLLQQQIYFLTGVNGNLQHSKTKKSLTDLKNQINAINKSGINSQNQLLLKFKQINILSSASLIEQSEQIDSLTEALIKKIKKTEKQYESMQDNLDKIIKQIDQLQLQGNKTEELKEMSIKSSQEAHNQELKQQEIIDLKIDLLNIQKIKQLINIYQQYIKELNESINKIIASDDITNSIKTLIKLNQDKILNLQEQCQCIKYNYFMQFQYKDHIVILSFPDYMFFEIENGFIYCYTNTLRKLSSSERAEWGRLIAETRNTIYGLHTGFTKSLYLKGVGYKASVQDNILTLHLGYSHAINMQISQNAKVAVTVEPVKKDVAKEFYNSSYVIKISGKNKQDVSDFATKIIRKRKYNIVMGNGIIDPKKYRPRKQIRKTN